MRTRLRALMPAFLRAYPGLSVRDYWALTDADFQALYAGLRGEGG